MLVNAQERNDVNETETVKRHRAMYERRLRELARAGHEIDKDDEDGCDSHLRSDKDNPRQAEVCL